MRQNQERTKAMNLYFFTILVDGKECSLISSKYSKKKTAENYNLPEEIIIKRGATAGLPEITEEILKKAGIL